MANKVEGLPRYDVKVKLTGEDGNAFNLLAVMDRALARAGASMTERKKFRDEATSGDYDHLLRVCMSWVHVV